VPRRAYGIPDGVAVHFTPEFHLSIDWSVRVRRFELALPDSVEECIRILSERGTGTKLVAGGTDLIPQLRNALLRPACVVDLSGVPELRRIEDADGGGLRIGSAVTARALELDPRVRSRYPSLAESAALVGSIQVRNLATLGGNLCNAAPSADMAPPLLALDAAAVIAGPGGRRTVPVASFFRGVRQTALAPGELLVELVLQPPPPRSGGTYLRHTPRRELDIAVVGVASQLTLSNGTCARARIALAAVAPTPVRATAAEQALEGQAVTPALIERAADLARAAARPIDDQRGSAEFRRHLVGVLARRTLETALARAAA
jgi:carbon-monoxide dehydrogenase medium subunit